VGQEHLPRLAPQHYCGRTFVHWTLTLEARATGWLNERFHQTWMVVLTHGCARYHLAAPIYVLMPDHIHVMLCGLHVEADQRQAVTFVQKHLRSHLAPADWQRSPYDHVLTEHERERAGFAQVANYIAANPVRAGLVEHSSDYPFTGCCVPGYPEFEVRAPDYWDRFWRCYNFLVERGSN
jgi:putative transposase